MHTKDFVAEFKALTASDGATRPGEFEAIVAVFDNVDKVGDRIKSSAFDETLEAWRKSGDPIPIVMAHGWDDAWKHIGYARPEDVKAIPGRGLYAKGVLDIDDNPLAKQVHRLMERRTIKEFSFGYNTPPGGEQKASDGAFDLLKLDLIEFGPCLRGINDSTELLAVKAELASERRREKGEEPTLEERLTRLEVILGDQLMEAQEPEETKAECPGCGTREQTFGKPCSECGEVVSKSDQPEGAKADEQADEATNDPVGEPGAEIEKPEISAEAEPAPDAPGSDVVIAEEGAETVVPAEPDPADVETKASNIELELRIQGLDSLEASLHDVLSKNDGLDSAERRIADELRRLDG